MNKIDVFLAGEDDDDDDVTMQSSSSTLANTLPDQFTQDSSNLSNLTKETAGVAEKLCKQFQMLLFNINTSKRACMNGSTNLTDVMANFSDSIGVGSFKLNLVKMLMGDKQRAEDIQSEVQRLTSDTVNESQLLPSLLTLLQEMQDINAAQERLYQSLHTINNDLAQNKNPTTNTSQFTLSDVNCISNVSIVEIYDRDLQKIPSLYRNWLTMTGPRLAEIFKNWPMFKRVDSHGLFISTPPNSTESFLAKVDSKFFQTTTEHSLAAITELENQLAIALQKFWDLNKIELEKSQLGCVKQFQPPFGHVEDIDDNIFSANLAQPTDMSANTNLRLMLTAGDQQQYTSVLVTPNNTYAIELSGNSCGCRTFKPNRSQSGFSSAANGEDDYDYFTLGTGRRQRKRRRQLIKKCKKQCMKKCRGDNDDFEYELGCEQTTSDFDFRTAGNKDVEPQVGVNVTLNSTIRAADIQRRIYALAANTIMRANSSLDYLPAVADSFFSMLNAVNDFDSLQNLVKVGKKKSLSCVSRGEIEALEAAFAYNVINSDDIKCDKSSTSSSLSCNVYKLNYEAEYNLLKKILEMTKTYEYDPQPGELLLPQSKWYVKTEKALKAYNACDQQLTSIMLKKFSVSSGYNNKQTMGSIGVLNQDASSFVVSEDKKVIKYKTDSGRPIANDFEMFKRSMVVDQTTKKIENLRASKEAMQKIIDNANAALVKVIATAIPKIERQYSDVYAKNMTEILKEMFVSRTLCERISNASNTSLGQLWKSMYAESKAKDFFSFLCELTPEQIRGEQFGERRVPAVGCLLSMISARPSYIQAINTDNSKVYYPNNHPIIPILSDIADFIEELQKLEYMPFENQKLVQPGSAVSGATANLPTLALVPTDLDVRIKELEDLVSKMAALKVDQLEKRFSTPILEIGRNVTEVFTLYG